MADVTQLRPVAPSADPGLVDMLRDLLARAESGEIIAVAVAAQSTGGDIARATSLGTGSDAFALVGAMRMLEFGLLAQFAAEGG